MRRLTNTTTGVTVTVRDGHPGLGRGWEPDGEDGNPAAAYDRMTVAALKDEIRRRNDGRPDSDQLPLGGRKADLAATLADDD